MPKEKTPAQIWKEEEARKAKQAKTAAERKIRLEGDGVYTGQEAEEVNPELQSDWERMAELARTKFPPHYAEKYKLSPNQRVSAIAWCLGWSQEKIAKASGCHQTTVSRWFRENENLKQLIEAFNYHSGNKDSKEIVDREVYNSLQTVVSLRDNMEISAPTRLDAAKWIWEQKYGKAKESREIKGVNLRDLTEALKARKAGAEEIMSELLDESANES